MLDQKKIWSSTQLPSLPTAAMKLLELARDTDTEIGDVAAVIKLDPALTAKILKAANSSYFGFKNEVESVDRAVTMLGTAVVTSVALSFSLIESASSKGPMADHFKSFWMRSLVQAVAGEILGEQAGISSKSEFFLMGLLVDIGQLAMLATIPDEYAAVLDATTEQPRDVTEIESDMLGFDHLRIGCKLAESWKLPAVLISAIELHHADVVKIVEQRENEDYCLFRIVAVAAAVGDYFCGGQPGIAAKRLKKLTRELFSFSDDDLNNYIDTVNLRTEQAGELFSINTEDLLSPTELMVQANENLAQLSVQAHMEMANAARQNELTETEKRELQERNRELQRQALFDPLTKIYNRRFFDESLQNEISRCRRTGQLVGVVFCDIDEFKMLNDTYGHQFGDVVLHSVAQDFGSVLRDCDILARFGGEEFVILVNDPTEQGLTILAERLRAQIEAQRHKLENDEIKVTVSIGAAVGLPSRNSDDIGSKLIEAADKAMYKSKAAGRNQSHVLSIARKSEQNLDQQVRQSQFSQWLVAHDVCNTDFIMSELPNIQFESSRIGEMACHEGYLDAAGVSEILADQSRSGDRFCVIAIRCGLLSEAQVVYILAQQKEDARTVAQAFIETGKLDAQEGAELLEQYFAEVRPQEKSDDCKLSALVNS
jgi:diguanylate cyclase (GGDEF)-like protein